MAGQARYHNPGSGWKDDSDGSESLGRVLIPGGTKMNSLELGETVRSTGELRMRHILVDRSGALLTWFDS